MFREHGLVSQVAYQLPAASFALVLTRRGHETFVIDIGASDELGHLSLLRAVSPANRY